MEAMKEKMKKVLIVDNDEVSLKYYEYALLHHNTIMVTSGDAAIKKFIEEKIDVVIINCYSRGEDYFRVAKEIRALNQLVKISIVSTYEGALKEALAINCDSFYLKPINRENLIEMTK